MNMKLRQYQAFQAEETLCKAIETWKDHRQFGELLTDWHEMKLRHW